MRTLLLATLALSWMTWPVSLQPQDPKPDPGRVGQVFDCQGIAWVRPVGRQRWSALAQRFPLAPGDLLRVDPRGANALEIELSGGPRLVLGPGTHLELASSTEVRMLSGELEVGCDEKHPLTVHGTGGYRGELKGKAILRAEASATGTLAVAPRWLAGYRASTTSEWLGALLAKVDGRDVPLHVGYHKVDVVIKDQIAETTIEESFVNSTDSRLEGTFRFPLPADASISGFGMWIGNELVEADVVEKQRARQIYEDILRRKKDPGLLEWNGGNLFTARVFPIEAHSEKRIRLRYTQVLSLLGDQFSYRYALRSELLRSHPLRQLQIRVHVDSSVPLAEALCTTHPVRARSTATTAVLEYDASEVTPDRDFEARIRLGKTGGATLVPHRRGSDGYFMLTLAGEHERASGLPRELVPDGAPLHLILLADTSGSIHKKERAAQESFLRGLFAALAPQDRFELWACDVVVQKFAPAASPVDEANTSRALDWLMRRDSLGWTDLDRAFAEVRQNAPRDAVVVYLGDGIGTTGDADPQALARRLESISRAPLFSIHAVALGSSYEAPVLEALARYGSGSVRNVGDDAARCATSLLAEIAQPTIKDLLVEFEGLRTACVYPERLPNLPSGSQQIVLGRFLPSGKAQTGRVVVTGRVGDRKVRFATEVAMREDDEGNSFLPRLWARRHLDSLLARGSGKSVQEEIVAFSTEYCIMTPYTSLLVLETDEDRERYGVARRVKMRDAERFFAEARDQANLEQTREQMRLAHGWRLQLKEQARRRIAGLGKDLHGQQSERAVAYGRAGYLGKSRRDEPVSHGLEFERAGLDAKLLPAPAERDGLDLDSEDAMDRGDAGARSAPETLGEPNEEAADDLLSAMANEKKLADQSTFRLRSELAGEFDERGKRFTRLPGSGGLLSGKLLAARGDASHFGFDSLGFPALGPFVVQAQAPKSAWDPAVLQLVDRLNRAPAIAALPRGLSITAETRQTSLLRGHTMARSRSEASWGKGGWLVRTQARNEHGLESWLTSGERGVLYTDTRLARVRAAGGRDSVECPIGLQELAGCGVVGLASWSASLVEIDADTVELRLVAPSQRNQIPAAVTLRIDRARGVLLSRVDEQNGQAVEETTCSEFVQVSGIWLATVIERKLPRAAMTRVQRLQVAELAEGALEKLLGDARMARADMLSVPVVEPALAACKEARHARAADHSQLLRIACHFASLQLWDEALAAVSEAEAKTSERFATRWVREHFLVTARRGEEALALARALAAEAQAKGQAATILAATLDQHLAQVLGPMERLSLWQSFRAAFVVPGEDAPWLLSAWRSRTAMLLEGLGRTTDALALLRENVSALPMDLATQLELVHALVRSRDASAARDQVKSIATGRMRFSAEELDLVYTAWSDAAYGQLSPADLLAICEAWTVASPASEAAWLRRGSSLLFLGNEPVLDAWIRDQFGRIPDPRDDAAFSQLGAAIALAQGSGWGYQQRSSDARWLGPLRDLALTALRHANSRSWQLGQRIAHDYRFGQTDAGREFRAALLADLGRPEFVTGAPLGQVEIFCGWQSWDRSNVDPVLWRQVVTGMGTRFVATREVEERRGLAHLLLQVLDSHGEAAEALAFVRTVFSTVSNEQRQEFASNLFERLRREAWSQAIEDELFVLLPELLPMEADPQTRIRSAGDRLRALCESLEQMRSNHLLGPAAEREKLSRAELKAKTIASNKATAAGLAERCQREIATAKEPWRAWLSIERVAYLAAAGAPANQLFAEAKEVWATLPLADADIGCEIQRVRTLLALFWAASKRGAEPALGDEALAICLAGDRQHPDNLDWKGHAAVLLIALDRTDKLIDLTKTWIVPSKAETTWRVLLAWLLAERGVLVEAVETLEAARAGDEVDAATLRALAGWNLALGDDARRMRAIRRAFEVSSENELQQRLWAAQRRAQPSGNQPGASIEPETLILLEVLMRKASYPGNVVGAVTTLYAQTKDIRLLESLADGVIGHTTEGVYGFLTTLLQVIGSVHEEATLDSILARVAARSGEVHSDTDRRGLALLCMLCERRAGEVTNQAGPHWRNALQALQRARKGQYLPGERVAHANLLAALGLVKDAEFAREQVAQVEQLRGEASAGFERLAITRALATLHWANQRKSLATDLLAAGLVEYRQVGASLPEAFGMVCQLEQWLQERGRFADAERLLEGWRASASGELGNQYKNRLSSLYVNCLRQDGTVSLGRGVALYKALDARARADLSSAAEGELDAAKEHYGSLHETAFSAEFPGVLATVKDFARADMVKVCLRLPTQASSIVRRVAEVLAHSHDYSGAIAVALDRIESEPRWLERIDRDLWQTASWNLAEWRSKSRLDSGLAKRLLARVLVALEADLLAGTQESSAFWNQHNTYCWREKRSDYLTVFRRVLELKASSPAIVRFCAEQLWSALDAHGEAIATLVNADRRKPLAYGDRGVLVRWLMHESRFAEALPHLDLAIAEVPDELENRLLKMRALNGIGRREDSLAWGTATKKLLEGQKRWNESAAASLAFAFFECSLWDQAVTNYRDAIASRDRAGQRAQSGDSVLANYYGHLGQALVRLARHDEAIEAASAAVVIWPDRHHGRRTAIEALRSTIEAIPDLAAYVGRRELAVQQSGADAPLLRKLCGQVFAANGDLARARQELVRALELQPDDKETHEALLAVVTRLADTAGQIAALRQANAVFPSDLGFISRLGEALVANGDGAEAERAFTNLVEAVPSEFEGHKLLAEQRERQRRLPEAIEQWEQVVRIRPLDPTGWIALAKAQIAAGRAQEARKTVDHLLATTWEAHYGDVKREAAALMPR